MTFFLIKKSKKIKRISAKNTSEMNFLFLTNGNETVSNKIYDLSFGIIILIKIFSNKNAK